MVQAVGTLKKDKVRESWSIFILLRKSAYNDFFIPKAQTLSAGLIKNFSAKYVEQRNWRGNTQKTTAHFQVKLMFAVY